MSRNTWKAPSKPWSASANALPSFAGESRSRPSGWRHSSASTRAGCCRRARKPKLKTKPEFLGHAHFPYPADLRRVVLGAMNSPRASVADLARLNFLLGDLYAEAVLSAQKQLRMKADLAGCHGQTLYHQGLASVFLGRELAVTWQVGE